MEVIVVLRVEDLFVHVDVAQAIMEGFERVVFHDRAVPQSTE